MIMMGIGPHVCKCRDVLDGMKVNQEGIKA